MNPLGGTEAERLAAAETPQTDKQDQPSHNTGIEIGHGNDRFRETTGDGHMHQGFARASFDSTTLPAVS
jgi:hypothetical protein